MEVEERLMDFYEATSEDTRIGMAHITLYVALLRQWKLNQYENPVCISRKEVMRAARMSSLQTYYKSLHELEEYGYVRFVPSFNPTIKSQVYLKRL